VASAVFYYTQAEGRSTYTTLDHSISWKECEVASWQGGRLTASLESHIAIALASKPAAD